MWDLVPCPRVKPSPPALGSASFKHWTTREVPPSFFLSLFLSFCLSLSLSLTPGSLSSSSSFSLSSFHSLCPFLSPSLPFSPSLSHSLSFILSFPLGIPDAHTTALSPPARSFLDAALSLCLWLSSISLPHPSPFTCFSCPPHLPRGAHPAFWHQIALRYSWLPNLVCILSPSFLRTWISSVIFVSWFCSLQKWH